MICDTDVRDRGRAAELGATYDDERRGKRWHLACSRGSYADDMADPRRGVRRAGCSSTCRCVQPAAVLAGCVRAGAWRACSGECARVVLATDVGARRECEAGECGAGG